MTTVAEPQIVPDDDDDWLYGDEKSKEEKPDVDALDKQIDGAKANDESSNGQDKDNGDAPEAETKEDGSDNSDDDDDDDDVQVTIGDIRTWTSTDGTQRNLFKSGQNYQKAASATTPAKPAAATKGLDIEAVGTINNVPTYDFDINHLNVEDMPWRKPGADITDYFNYGFNEETWKAYCEKQRILRMEASLTPNAARPMFSATAATAATASKPQSANNITVNKSTLGSNTESSINVIGTIGTIGGNSRRKEDLATSINRNIPINFNQPPPTINTNLPPPGLPVPTPFGVPPPSLEAFIQAAAAAAAEGRGLPVPPPNFGSGLPPPTWPPPFSDVTTNQPPPQWESSSYPDNERDRWDTRRERERDRNDRSPTRDDDLERLCRDKSVDRGRDRDYRDRERDRSRDRDYDRRDYRDRDRERDRGRDRDRDRDYRDRGRDRSISPDRSRDRDRDREDRHKTSSRSSRKHRDRDDSDTESRSGGKRSKKSKRRKEDSDTTAAEEEKSKD